MCVLLCLSLFTSRGRCSYMRFRLTTGQCLESRLQSERLASSTVSPRQRLHSKRAQTNRTTHVPARRTTHDAIPLYPRKPIWSLNARYNWFRALLTSGSTILRAERSRANIGSLSFVDPRTFFLEKNWSRTYILKTTILRENIYFPYIYFTI